MANKVFQKLTSVILCLAIMFTMSPVPIFADDDEGGPIPVEIDAGSELLETEAPVILQEDADPVAEDYHLHGINISGVGCYNNVEHYASGVYESRIDPDDMDVSSHFLNRYMGFAVSMNQPWDLETEAKVTFQDFDFLVESDSVITREIVLFSDEELEEDLITMRGDATLSELDGSVYGDGGGALYYYTGEITIPAEDCTVELLYDGHVEKKMTFNHRFPHWHSNWTFLTTFDIESFEMDANDIVTDFTVIMSGFNIPADASRLRMGQEQMDENWDTYIEDLADVISITGPDRYGYYRMQCRIVDGIVEPNDICWLDLFVDDEEVFMFEELSAFSKIGSDELRSDRWTYGTFATLCPYYSLSCSMPFVAKPRLTAPESTTESAITIQIDPRDYAGGQMAYSLTYDPDLKANTDITNSVEITFPLKKFGEYTVYFAFSKEGQRDCNRKLTVIYKCRDGFVRAEHAPTLAYKTAVDSEGNTYRSVKPGDTLTGIFTALCEEGWTQKMVLRYNDLSGAEKTVEPLWLSNNGHEVLTGEIRIPSDADDLIELRYELLNPGGAVNNFISYDFSNYRTEAEVVAGGFSIDYDGASLTMSRKGFSKTYFLNTKEKSSVSLGDLATGTYNYEVSGRSGIIASGTVDVERGEDIWLSLPQLCEFTVSTNDSLIGLSIPASVNLTMTTPDSNVRNFAVPAGAVVEQIPVGTSVKAALDFDIDAFPNVDITEFEQNVTLTGDDDEIIFEYTQMTMRTLSGYVTYPSKRPLGNVLVTVTQQIERCGKVRTYTATGLTWGKGGSEYGRFHIQAYSGFPATVEFRSFYGTREPIAVNETQESVGPYYIEIDKPADIIIMPKLKYSTAPVVDENGKTVVDPIITDVDSSLLNITSISCHGTDIPAEKVRKTVIDGQLVITIDSGVIDVNDLNAENAIIVYANCPDINGKATKLSSYYSHTSIDENGSATVTFTAQPDVNEVRAVISAGDGYVGFLGVVYDDSSFLQNYCTYAYGTGELTVPFSYYGSAKVIALKVRESDVSAMLDYLGTDPFNSGKGFLQAMESETRSNIVVKNTSLTKGQIVDVGDMTPNGSAGSKFLPAYSFTYIPTIGDTGGTIHISGYFEKRFPDLDDKTYINTVKLYVTDEDEYSWQPTWAQSKFLFGGENCRTYYNGETYWSRYYQTNSSKWKTLQSYKMISFSADVPMTRQNQIRFKMEVTLDNGKTEIYSFFDNLDVFNLEVPDSYIIPKSEYVHIHQTWTMPVSLRAFPRDTDRENVITIWDNGTAVSTINIKKTYYQVYGTNVTLVDCMTPGVHVMWATREILMEDGTYETISTERRAFTLENDSCTDIYVYGLSWTHWNSRNSDGTPEIMYFENLGDMAGRTIWVWPGKRSDFLFNIKNARPGKEISGVDLVITMSNGTVQHYKAELFGSFDGNDLYNPSSSWRVEKVYLGAVTGISFEIYYAPGYATNATLEERRENELETFNRANGFGDAEDDEAFIGDLLEASGDQLVSALNQGDYMPDIFEGLSLKVTEDSDTRLKVGLTKSTSDVKSFDVTMTKVPKTKAGEIYTLMEKEQEDGKSSLTGEEGWDVHWSETESLQGRTIVRTASFYGKQSDGTYKTVTKQTTYLLASLVDAFEGGYDLSVQGYENDGLSLQEYVEETLSLQADGDEDPLLYKGYQTVNEIHTYRDIANTWYTEAVYNAEEYITKSKDLAKQASDKANFIPKKVGTAMNWLGVADVAYTYYKGPSGKDASGLTDLLSRVKDEKFRKSIESQIRDYEGLRSDIFKQEMTMKSVTAAANFAPAGFWTKAAVFIGSKGFDFINDMSKEYNQKVYELTLHDIQRQLSFEQYKAERAQAEADFRAKMDRIYGKGAWTERMLIEEKSYYVLAKNKEGQLSYMWKASAPSFNTYIDPSGFVFEATEENKLDGVTATLYYSDTLDDDGNPIDFTVWEDPNTNEAERQNNPLITSEGRYSWMVPVGWWKVRYEADGYKTTESIPMEVPPAHTEVNIGMLSEEAPKAAVSVADGDIMILFDKYMQLESLINLDGVSASEGETDYLDTEKLSYEDESFDSSLFAVLFTDSANNYISGTVSFPDKVENTGYKGTGYGTDIIDSDYFVRTAVFTPDSPVYGKVSWTFADGMKSYAGVPLKSGKASVFLISFDPNGGTIENTQVITGADGTLDFLAMPAREDYVCDGWYTAKHGGEKVTLETVFTQNTTVYAHWEEDPEAQDRYLLEASAVVKDMKVTFTAENSTLRGVYKLIAAAYNSDGKFISSQTASLTFNGGDITKTFTFEGCSDAEIRAFLMKDDEPVWYTLIGF